MYVLFAGVSVDGKRKLEIYENIGSRCAACGSMRFVLYRAVESAESQVDSQHC